MLPVNFILFALQAAFLTKPGIFDAEAFVAAPREDFLRLGRPSACDGENLSRVVAVELVVEFLADGIEGDQGGNGEVACQDEEELVVGAESTDQAEGFLLFRRSGRCGSQVVERDRVCFGCDEVEALQACGQL